MKPWEDSISNKAKCSLCETVIGGSSNIDFARCKCGAIAIEGNHKDVRFYFRQRENLIILDDEDNTVVTEGTPETSFDLPKPSKSEMIDMLDELRKRITSLPKEALYSPVTHSDFASLLMLLSSILREDCKPDN